MEPVERREEVRHVIECCLMSERRSCLLLGLDRSSYRYRPREKRHEELCARVRHKLAAAHPRYVYRRLCALLQREGQTVNHKRIERFYREQVLAVRRRKRKRLVRSAAATAPTLERAHHQWSLDFVSDTTA